MSGTGLSRALLIALASVPLCATAADASVLRSEGPGGRHAIYETAHTEANVLSITFEEISEPCVPVPYPTCVLESRDPELHVKDEGAAKINLHPSVQDDCSYEADNYVVCDGDFRDAVRRGYLDLVLGARDDQAFVHGLRTVADGGLGNDTIRVERARALRLTGGPGNDTLQARGGSLVGGDGDDMLRTGTRMSGGNGRDTLVGTSIKDELSGGDDYDRLQGRGGDDVLRGGADSDEMLGGDGADWVVLEDQPSTVVDLAGGYSLRGVVIEDRIREIENVRATPRDDVIRGSERRNVIRGLGGHDKIDGRGGNDSLLGGDGNDLVDAGAGQDRLRGDGGDDVLTGRFGNDRIEGGFGADSLDAGPGRDVLLGGPGSDQLTGGEHGDFIRGYGGVDVVRYDERTTAGVRVTMDGVTNDGAPGERDHVARDVEAVFGTPLADSIVGNHLDNVVFGKGGNDVIAGGAGDDTLIGEDGDDEISGQQGNDTLYGNLGTDRLFGAEGNDRIFPSADNGAADTVRCGADTDSVFVNPPAPDAIDPDCEQVLAEPTT